MITLEHVYVLAGLIIGAFAILSALDRTNSKRPINTAFWGLLAISFLFGSELGDLGNGVLVLGLVILGALGLGRGTTPTTTPDDRRANALSLGNWIFVPALIIPIVALLGSLFLKTASIGGVALLDPKQVTLISLG